MTPPVLSFVLAAGTALLVALITTPLVRKLAISLRLVDDPGLRKVHKTPIANIGGAALMASLLAGLTTLLALEPELAAQWWSTPHQGLAVLIALIAIFFVGLTDDIINLRVRHKALAQIAIATGLYFAGVRLDNIQFTGNVSQSLGVYSYPLTVVFLVGITNAFNLIDGLDGLAAGIATIVCASLAVLGIEYGQYLLAGMALILLASLLGFLVYNRNPARIYLGDCGSLTLGLFVASGSLLSLQANHRYISLAVPLLAAAVPLLDCLHCMLRRTLERRSPFGADKGHIHHLLISLGIPHARAVFLLHSVTATATTFAILALWRGGVPRMLLLIAGLFTVAAFFWAIGYFSFRSILTNLRQVRAVSRQEKHAQRAYELLCLQMREVTTFDQWWTTLCKAAQALSFDSVSLPIQTREFGPRTLSWTASETLTANTSNSASLTLQTPIPQRRRHEPLQATVTINPTHTGLELCAARFRLFARLLDEHNPLTLVPRTRSQPQPHLPATEVSPGTFAPNIATTA